MAFLGQDGFYWGIGVVEDRFDPEKLNRIRVRWLGIHDDDKDKILTKDLPWAQVMQPVSSSSMAGVGDTNSSISGLVDVMCAAQNAADDGITNVVDFIKKNGVYLKPKNYGGLF